MNLIKKERISFRSSDSARTQTTTTHSDTHPNTNKPDHLTTAQKHPNLVERGGKKRGEKKVRKSDENCVEKLNKQPNFSSREGEVTSAYFTNKPMILLVYKEAYFNTNDLDHIVPSVAISLLQEFDNSFPDDTPNRLPPLRGKEHQIDFVRGALIPNRPSYKRNPEEMTGLERQIYELIDKGYIREYKPVWYTRAYEGWNMEDVLLSHQQHNDFDSRSNPFEERGDDANLPRNTSKDYRLDGRL